MISARVQGGGRKPPDILCRNCHMHVFGVRARQHKSNKHQRDYHRFGGSMHFWSLYSISPSVYHTAIFPPSACAAGAHRSGGCRALASSNCSLGRACGLSLTHNLLSIVVSGSICNYSVVCVCVSYDFRFIVVSIAQYMINDVCMGQTSPQPPAWLVRSTECRWIGAHGPSTNAKLCWPNTHFACCLSNTST